MYSPELLAYTAGIFDGEGSISFLKRKNAKGASLRIGITNTHIETLYQLRADWNNLGIIQIRASNNAKWKTRGDWRIGGEDAKMLLSAIYPYLRIKRARAEIVLGLVPRKYRHKYSEIEALQVEEAINKMKDLNKRGAQESN